MQETLHFLSTERLRRLPDFASRGGAGGGHRSSRRGPVSMSRLGEPSMPSLLLLVHMLRL